ncbi:MAG: murein hydrolase activator EnvC [Hyphomicrobiales bacterium]|nr:murein hydrolase activator EnvC [Hyphomicrobiales bacterium]
MDPARAGAISDLKAQHARGEAEYEQLARRVTLSDRTLAALTKEVASIRKDQTTITAALIQAAKTERKLSQDIDDIGARLDTLGGQEKTIRKSLGARRGVLAEVLGALERMGVNPPPAILVKPEDALSSVRSAILLGAVVPDLRAETEVLVGDLKELSRVSKSIETERGRLLAKVEEQTEEKTRLGLLLEEKKKLQQRSEAALADEQAKAAELAKKAGSIKELIASLEAQIESVRKAEAEAANRPAPEGHRLAATPFAAMKGHTPLPVAGRVDKRFGDDDGTGGSLQGDMLITQSGAIVTTPADGIVLYAGPFRSYGQLLILDAGDGYHVVLAGMDRISVSLGQSVLAGEPVGLMGEARLASTVAFSGENTGPELYVEFRKDGKPIDPSPWWMERISGRTGNDS